MTNDPESSPPSRPPQTPTLEARTTTRPWLPIRLQRVVLAVILVTGALLLGVDLMGSRGIAGVIGAFFVAYAGLLLPGVMNLPVVGPRVARWGEEWMRDMGKGYYSVVALAVFLRLEASLLLRRIQAVIADEVGILATLASELMDLGLSSLFNALYSMLWPFHLVNVYGYLPAAAFIGLSWTAFWLGSRRLQTPNWMLADPASDSAGSPPPRR